jgi:hypothetical protein
MARRALLPCGRNSLATENTTYWCRWAGHA